MLFLNFDNESYSIKISFTFKVMLLIFILLKDMLYIFKQTTNFIRNIAFIITLENG